MRPASIYNSYERMIRLRLPLCAVIVELHRASAETVEITDAGRTKRTCVKLLLLLALSLRRQCLTK